MTILKNLRKPYFAMFLSFLMLFISCKQYDSELNEIEQSFDYKAFNTYKNTNHLDAIINKINTSNKDRSNLSVLETNKLILSTVNDELDTGLYLPESLLSMSVDMEANDIYEIALTNNWLDIKDVELTKNFANDAETIGFDLAVENYQNKVLALNLSSKEFAKKNIFINAVKALDYENPKLFTVNNNTQARGWYRCALATIALAATTAALASCITIVACSLAVLLQVNAVYGFADQCLS
jgi:hypothetical protein